MPLPQGIAFRTTLAFVTDVSPDFCESANMGVPTYPQTTPEGNNVGWETADEGTNILNSRDRNTSVPRLAGIHYGIHAAGVQEYRIDLPSAGDKLIRLAAGDYSYGGSPTNVELFDTTTSLGVLASATTAGAQRYIDATNVERTSTADWVANNASATKTFASTILRFKIGTGAVSGGLSFFFVDDFVAPTPDGKVIDYSKFPIEKLAAGPRSLLA